VFGLKLGHSGNVAQSCRTIQDFFSSERSVHDDLSCQLGCRLFCEELT
jgi:hypothetical protein